MAGLRLELEAALGHGGLKLGDRAFQTREFGPQIGRHGDLFGLHRGLFRLARRVDRTGGILQNSPGFQQRRLGLGQKHLGLGHRARRQRGDKRQDLAPRHSFRRLQNQQARSLRLRCDLRRGRQHKRFGRDAVLRGNHWRGGRIGRQIGARFRHRGCGVISLGARFIGAHRNVGQHIRRGIGARCGQIEIGHGRRRGLGGLADPQGRAKHQTLCLDRCGRRHGHRRGRTRSHGHRTRGPGLARDQTADRRQNVFDFDLSFGFGHHATNPALWPRHARTFSRKQNTPSDGQGPREAGSHPVTAMRRTRTQFLPMARKTRSRDLP